MAQIDDLNAAIADLTTQVTSQTALITKVDTDLAALAAQIAAGGTGPDLTAAIAAIRANIATVQTDDSSLTAADNAAVPPAAPQVKQ